MLTSPTAGMARSVVPIGRPGWTRWPDASPACPAAVPHKPAPPQSYDPYQAAPPQSYDPYQPAPQPFSAAPYPASPVPYQQPYPPQQPVHFVAVPVAPTSGTAVVSLIAGIIGILGGWCVFGVPCAIAIITGHVAQRETRTGARGG